MDDYGTKSIDYAVVNEDNLKSAHQQYLARFEDTVENYKDIETKTRWGVAFIGPVAVALIGYIFIRSTTLSPCGVIGLSTISLGLWVGLLFIGASLLSRTYANKGMTPKRLDIRDWQPLLSDSDGKEARRFIGMQIAHLANAISNNSESNSKKAKWFARGSWVTLSSLPLAAIVFAVCIVLSYVLTGPTICPVTV